MRWVMIQLGTIYITRNETIHIKFTQKSFVRKKYLILIQNVTNLILDVLVFNYLFAPMDHLILLICNEFIHLYECVVTFTNNCMLMMAITRKTCI